jgi:Tol biopolymer transport system component
MLTLAVGWLGWQSWKTARLPKERIEFAMSPPFGSSLFPYDLAGIAVSPDGKRVVYAATGLDGKQRLWLRDLGSVISRELPETAGGYYPFWSPDGAFVGFFAEEKLKKISIAGGPPQVIADKTPSGRGASWLDDGTILFAPNVYSGIHRVNAAGGPVEEITRLNPQTDVTHRWPVPLPDGKHFLYLQRGKKNGGREAARLIAASYDGKTSKLVLDNATNAVYVDGQLLYGRDRSLMIQPFDLGGLELTGEARMLVKEKLSYWEAKNLLIFSVSQNGVLAYLPRVDSNLILRVLDRNGRELQRLTEKGELGGGAFSPDGNQVAYSVGDSEAEQDIWLYDLVRKRANRVTFEPGTYSGIGWTPDASALYFIAQPKGVADVFRKRLPAGTVEPFVSGVTWKTTAPGAISPDGKRFAFGAQSGETAMDIWIKQTDKPDAEPELFLRTPADEFESRFSPDGRWIVYTSTATGRPEVYVRSAFGLDQWQVSSEGGLVGCWRKDGRELFYITPEGQVMAVALGAGENLDPGEPVPLFDLRAASQIFASSLQDVAPDGSSFLVSTPAADQASPAFHVVMNWNARQAP